MKLLATVPGGHIFEAPTNSPRDPVYRFRAEALDEPKVEYFCDIGVARYWLSLINDRNQAVKRRVGK